MSATRLVDFRRRTDGDFVESILAVDDHGMFGAEQREHTCQRLAQAGNGDAGQLATCASRIGQRTQDVEHRAHADMLLWSR